jgi:hypothetical protein
MIYCTFIMIFNEVLVTMNIYSIFLLKRILILPYLHLSLLNSALAILNLLVYRKELIKSSYLSVAERVNYFYHV